MSSENKKREQAMELLRAMGEIDDRFLMEAMTVQDARALSGSPNAEPAQEEPAQETSGKTKSRRSRLRRYSTWALTAAACLTVVVIGRYVSVNSIKESTDTKAPVAVQEKLTEEQNKDREAVAAGGAMNSAVAGVDKKAEAAAGEEQEAPVSAAAEAADAAPEAVEEAADDYEAEVPLQAADEAPAQAAAEAEPEAARAPEEPMTAKGAQAAGAGAALTMPNPFIDTKTLEEAEEAAGFSITLPGRREDCDTVLYRAMPGQMIEVICLDKNQRELYRIRKGKNLEDDISGVMNETAISDTIESDDLKITVVGTEKDQWEYAVWTEDARDGTHYSYSIYADGASLSAEEFLRMAEEMM